MATAAGLTGVISKAAVRVGEATMAAVMGGEARTTTARVGEATIAAAMGGAARTTTARVGEATIAVAMDLVGVINKVMGLVGGAKAVAEEQWISSSECWGLV